MKQSEIDTLIKNVLPSLINAGWDIDKDVAFEVTLTDGQMINNGSNYIRSEKKRADIVLYLQPDVPLAVIEVKKSSKSVQEGIQQAIKYSEMLDVPFIFSSNGKGYIYRNEFDLEELEKKLKMDQFPKKEELINLYKIHQNIENGDLLLQSPKYKKNKPRYFQLSAINRTLKAISDGQKRLLLVLATGTGKTFTAFQIVWKFLKKNKDARVLYLADRNILIDQTIVGDFSPLMKISTKISGAIDKSYQVYFSLYQAITGKDEEFDLYKEFSRDFFDLIIVDECHRGSAKEESRWREILDYFSDAIHIGMTATPKESSQVSNIDYFGEPIYTYSLKQGIKDGFLAPYRVIRVNHDVDEKGLIIEDRVKDDDGEVLKKNFFRPSEIDKKVVIENRTKLVAKRIVEEQKKIDRFAKVIVFCQDQEHASRLRMQIVNELGKSGDNSRNFCMRITSDDEEGKSMLEDFIDPDKKYPVIATTSKLLSTGVDTKMVKMIVIDQAINSISEFKQMIGRGTRIDESRGKLFFTILDFRGATEAFSDSDFDGVPEMLTDFTGNSPDNSSEEKEIDTPPNSQQVTKYYFDDIEVTIVDEQIQFIDENGVLIVESFEDFSKKGVFKSFQSENEFYKAWLESDNQTDIEAQLIQNGFLKEHLEKIYGEDFSPFDLVRHIAFNHDLLTRKTRAEICRKKINEDLKDEIDEKSFNVIDTLISRFELHSEDIKNPKLLTLSEFHNFGSPTEIINHFNGLENYKNIVQKVDSILYTTHSYGK